MKVWKWLVDLFGGYNEPPVPKPRFPIRSYLLETQLKYAEELEQALTDSFKLAAKNADILAFRFNQIRRMLEFCENPGQYGA